MYNNYYNQYNGYQQQQNNFIPLYFVSSEEDVKRYIVMPNQMAYFKDINSNTLYEKKADNFSNYTTKKYELRDMSAPAPVYATIEDLQALRTELLGGNVHE